MILYFYLIRQQKRFPEPDTHRLLVGAALQAARTRAGYSIGEVVDLLAAQPGGSGEETAPRHRSSKGSLSRHERGQTAISLELFDALAAVYELEGETLHALVSDAWRRWGEGGLERAFKSASRKTRLVEYFRERLDGVAEAPWGPEVPAPNDRPVEVPLLGRPGADGRASTSTAAIVGGEQHEELLRRLRPGEEWSELLPIGEDPTFRLIDLARAAALAGRWQVGFVGPHSRERTRVQALLAEVNPQEPSRPAGGPPGPEVFSKHRAAAWLTHGTGGERLLLVDGGHALYRLRWALKRAGSAWPPQAAVVTFSSPLDGRPAPRCSAGRSRREIVRDGFRSGQLAPFDAWLIESTAPDLLEVPVAFSQAGRRRSHGAAYMTAERLRLVLDPRVRKPYGRTVVFCGSLPHLDFVADQLGEWRHRVVPLDSRGPSDRDEALRIFAADPDGWLCTARRLSRFDECPPLARILMSVPISGPSLEERVLPLLYASRGHGPVQIVELVEPGSMRRINAWKGLVRGVEDLCTLRVLPELEKEDGGSF